MVDPQEVGEQANKAAVDTHVATSSEATPEVRLVPQEVIPPNDVEAAIELSSGSERSHSKAEDEDLGESGAVQQVVAAVGVDVVVDKVEKEAEAGDLGSPVE